MRMVTGTGLETAHCCRMKVQSTRGRLRARMEGENKYRLGSPLFFGEGEQKHSYDNSQKK